MKTKTRRSLKGIISSLLTGCLIITGFPMAVGLTTPTVTAIVPTTMAKLSKEDDSEYVPFTWNETDYNSIIAKSADIQDIGRLPDYEEFKTLTGYQGVGNITLTEFREHYGTGSSFTAPSETVKIAVCSNDELDLLSALVNNTADSETAVEQAYYSTVDYVLGTELTYSGTKFKPIGTSTYPFNGSFDGQQFTIQGLSIIEDQGDSITYNGVGYFGLFGYIGADGLVENLGLSSMKISIIYEFSVDVAFLCGRNYGTIRNCYVNSKQTSTISVSNSTAGGITAENFGTIQGCYADAWVDVDVDSGSYSEPQPIATLNSGTVTNCYYLKHQLSSFYVPGRNYDVSTDTNVSRDMVGWKYSGDISQIYGTELAFYDFLHLSEYLPSFSNGGVAYSTSYPYDDYGKCYTPSELEAIFGTGSHFNKVYAEIFASTQLTIKAITPEEYAIYQKHKNRTITESDEEFNVWDRAYVYTTAQSSYRMNRNYNNHKEVYIDFYPVLGKPEQDANGVYLIGSVPNLLWLIKYARDDKAKLIRTIDCSNVTIDYNPEGVFELDGTLTDTSDICNQIDLGVTKCYGLLNLTIKNTRLAKQADLSHIYLIGGQYILDSSASTHPYREKSYYIGRNLNNFHTSMDITIDYSNNSSYYWFAMAKEATASSISGRVICTIASNATVYPLAYTCNDCVAYTRFDMQVPSTSAYGMGYTVNHSICRVSYAATQPVFTDYSRYATIYGLGVIVTNSLADSIYDCRNQNGIAVFGQQCTNCTFSGQYYGNETYINYLSHMRLCGNATNIAITETAVFNGITTALVYGSDNVYFRGTWNTNIVGDVSQQLFSSSTNVTSYGAINIRPPVVSALTSAHSWMEGMGVTKMYSPNGISAPKISLMGNAVNGVQNSTVNFIDCDGIGFPNFSFYLWGSTQYSTGYTGSTKNRCYTSLNLDGNYYINTVIGTDDSRNTDEYYQYGNVYVGDNVYIAYLSLISASRYKRAANFGDVEIHNGRSMRFSLLGAANGYNAYTETSEYINYGSVLFEKTKVDDLNAFSSLCVIGNNYNGSSINYGDFTVRFGEGVRNKTDLSIMDSYGTMVGDLTVSNFKSDHKLYIYGSSFSQYGKITVFDIEATDVYVAACCPSGKSNTPIDIMVAGEVDIHDVKLTKESTSGSRYYSFTYDTFRYKSNVTSGVTDNLVSAAKIQIKNITDTGNKGYDMVINNGVGYAEYDDKFPQVNMYDFNNSRVKYDYGLNGRSVNLTVNNDLTVKDISTLNRLMYSGCFAVAGNDAGYKHNSSTVKLEDLQVNSIIYSGITHYHPSVDHQEWVNNETLTVRNITASAESFFCGISSGAYRDNNNQYLYAIPFNCYNIGSMDIDIGNAPITVAGIARGLRTNAKESTYPIVLNSSDITVTGSNNINVVGIQYTPESSYSLSKIFNAVNDGTIIVNQTGTGTVRIDGITNACKMIRSVENLANITTDSTKGQVTAITGSTSDCVGWVNYGAITAGYLNGYVSCLIPKDSSSSTEYGINYGTFTGARSLDDMSTKYIIDLSGNQETVPIGNGTFSTDNAITGNSVSADIRINDFDAVAGRQETQAEDFTHTKHVDYTDIIKPEFGLRYNNIVLPMYITETEKNSYNKLNLLEYADADKLRGILRSTVSSIGNYGGYVLTATDFDDDPYFGVALESMMFENNRISQDNMPEWWDNFSVGNQTFKNYVTNRLMQREIGSIFEAVEISLESVDEYTTKNGGTSKIMNKSSLIPFQGPIDGDNDGEYSQNTIVTILDEYIVVNEFQDIVGETIAWKLKPMGSVLPDHLNVIHLYKNPIITGSSTDFKQSIKTLLADENYLANDLTEELSTSLPVQDVGGTTYAIVGYVLSEDGRKTNVIALRLNSTTTDPLGWATSFTYPTGYEVNGNSFRLVSTDAFGGSQSYYDETKGYEPYETDKTTVERLTPANADYNYPKYTMTQNMLHTTDKTAVSSTELSRLKTDEVRLKFRVQNVKDYTIRLDGDNQSFYYTEDITNITGDASADGTVIIKSIDKILTNTDFRTADDKPMTIAYSQYNPFLYGGLKTLTVTGHNINGDNFVLFVMDLTKSESIENYIKDSSVLRNWIRYHTSDPTDNYDNQALDIRKLAGIYFMDKMVSTLASKSNYRAEISELKQHGDYTIYPENIYSYVDVTAENGDTVTYLRNDKIVDFETVDVKVDNRHFAVWGGTPNYTIYRDNHIILNEGKTDCVAYMVPSTSQVTGFRFENVLLPDNSRETLTFTFDKIEVYVDGEYVHSLRAEGTDGMTMVDDEYGARFTLGNEITFRMGDVALNALPNAMSFRMYVKHTTLDGDEIKLQLQDFIFSKMLDSNYQLISSKLNKAISTTIVSDKTDELSENIEIGANGVFVYNVDYYDIEHIYIDDAVEPNCTSSEVEYEFSSFATLQYRDGSAWRNVSSAQNPYKTTYTFTYEGLQRGYTYEYRLIAQDFNSTTHADHVVYFTHRINAVTRNKTLTIEFNEEDQTTMDLYNAIIAQNGNLSVQVKNMNLDQIRLQQTKFYKSSADLESNYYNLSQGDFAILVNIPKEYSYQVRILGTSSEGYLKSNKLVKGQQLRLPYANAQNIRLVITLNHSTITNWGVSYEKSLYQSIRQNNV